MAMTMAGLKAKIKADMTSVIGAPEDAAAQDKFAEAIAKAVVEYLQSNAVPVGTVVVASGSSAGSYPVTLGTLT